MSSQQVRDSRSQAPIHAASQSGSVDVVVALLDRGVDVNTRGYAGATPLHVSVSNTFLKCFNLFSLFILCLYNPLKPATPRNFRKQKVFYWIGNGTRYLSSKSDVQ